MKQKTTQLHIFSTGSPFMFKVLSCMVLICFLIAWYSPVRSIISRRLHPAAVTRERDAIRFIAIAYIPARQVRDVAVNDHIDALVANGYVPIRLDDAIRLVHQGKPVPRNSVLLTVDAGDRDLLRQVRSAAKRYHWQGVAFFPPGSGSDRLDRRDLRSFQRNRSWDVGWLKNPVLVHEAQDNGRDEVRALAYPGGDFGQFHPSEDTSRKRMLRAAGTFDLVFTRDGTGRNTMFSDYRRINRLTVQPEWSAADLVAAMNVANREIETVENLDQRRQATGWIQERGRMTFDEAGMKLETAGLSEGALSWLAGSDMRRDFSASFEFQLIEGNAVFYARASAGLDRYIRVEFSPDGKAILEQKSLLNDHPLTLATARSPIRPGRRHRLAMFIRGSNINITIDGFPVFNTQEQCVGLQSGGLLGASVDPNEPDGAARMIVHSVIFQRRRSTMASWNLSAGYEPYITHWIQKHGSRLTEISPPLDRLHGYVPSLHYSQRSLYRLLSRLYNLRLTPGIQISSGRELQDWSPVALADLAGETDCDAIYVNFEKFNDLDIRELEQWVRQTARLLSGAGRPLLVRLPRAFERLGAVYSLLALIPSVEMVTDINTLLPLAASQPKQIIEEEIPAPSPDELNALPPVFMIQEQNTQAEAVTAEQQIREWIEQGGSAFNRGAYESAITAFSEWHRLAPSSPLPLLRIGDALANLGYNDEAIGFYRQSLDIDPGQISLATRLSRLLTENGRQTEARNILNSFARLFPDHPDILLAQAEWLYQNNRIDEVQERIDRILRIDPQHFEGTLFLLRMAADDAQRSIAMERLMKLSKTPAQQYQLVDAIYRYDLLSYRHSHLLIAAMDHITRQSEDPRIHGIIRKLEPLNRSVHADFSNGEPLPPEWLLEGAVSALQDEKLELKSASARNEFSLRLLRSERWRDSFIEAGINEVNGELWLYARRSLNHLVRFGFDAGAERLYLQVWKVRNNEIIINSNVPWVFPAKGCTLRLDVRGSGVVGLVDGAPVFEVPLALPVDYGLGWTALSVQSQDRGQATATLSHLTSGPLPVRIAVLPGAPAVNDEGRQTARLRARLAELTDISPDWFMVDAAGSWHSNVTEESDFYRLFARYYRLRLTPVVHVRQGADISAEDLITICRAHGFDGLLLRFEQMPAGTWFSGMDLELKEPGIDIIVMDKDNMGRPVVRGIAASRTLFLNLGSAIPVEIIDERGDGEPADVPVALPVIFNY